MGTSRSQKTLLNSSFINYSTWLLEFQLSLVRVGLGTLTVSQSAERFAAINKVVFTHLQFVYWSKNILISGSYWFPEYECTIIKGLNNRQHNLPILCISFNWAHFLYQRTEKSGDREIEKVAVFSSFVISYSRIFAILTMNY